MTILCDWCLKDLKMCVYSEGNVIYDLKETLFHQTELLNVDFSLLQQRLQRFRNN